MVQTVCDCLEGTGDIGDAVGAFCYGVGVSDQQSVKEWRQRILPVWNVKNRKKFVLKNMCMI